LLIQISRRENCKQLHEALNVSGVGPSIILVPRRAFDAQFAVYPGKPPTG
jgi:hypothetical protein